MQFKAKIAIMVFSGVIAFYAIVGSFMSKSGQAVARGSQYAQLTIFDEVLSHIIRDYVDEPDLEKVRVGSLRGLADGLDPYCAYLTPEQVKAHDPDAKPAGTGLVLSKVGGYAYVVSVLQGSPADQVGIKEGDFIEYVNSVPSRDLSLYDLAQFMNGTPGGVVELRILHQGQGRRVSVSRAVIAQPPLVSRIEEPGVGYIKVTSLAEGKAAELKAKLNELTTKGAQKIVLDLRGAANGEMSEGVAAANLFIGSGTLARVVGKGGKEERVLAASPEKVAFRGPLAVIIDRSTAGPAEVVAAAVRDRKRGEVVGERTFGMGTEQDLFPLSDGGALMITTARYAPESGKPFIEEPVNPTVKVERPRAELILPDGEDEEEVEVPLEQTQQTSPPRPEPQPEDVQLKKAVEILSQTNAKPGAAKRVAKAKPIFRTPAVRDYLLST